MMRTVAVIQARTGSTRLPGKVLADLGGRSVLAHVVERARRARCVDRVVVATTLSPSDDPLVDLGSSLDVAVVRGPSDDVLARYLLALQAHPADVVVRLTADCPLLDWRLIDRVVRTLRKTAAEYASNVNPPTYPDGYDVEAFTVECLVRLDRFASRAYEREHVTAHIREHPELYQTASVHCRRDLSALRLTLDTPDDLLRIRRLVDAMPGRLPTLGTVLQTIAHNPELVVDAITHERDHRYHEQRRAALLEERR